MRCSSDTSPALVAGADSSDCGCNRRFLPFKVPNETASFSDRKKPRGVYELPSAKLDALPALLRVPVPVTSIARTWPTDRRFLSQSDGYSSLELRHGAAAAARFVGEQRSSFRGNSNGPFIDGYRGTPRSATRRTLVGGRRPTGIAYCCAVKQGVLALHECLLWVSAYAVSL